MTDTRTFKFWKKEQIVWGYIKDANIILLKKIASQDQEPVTLKGLTYDKTLTV